MSDLRLTLMREGLADIRLEGVIEADRYAGARAMHCAAYAAGIFKGPDKASEQQDQLVFGEAFDVLDEADGYAFGQARRDGYVGWVETAALAEGIIVPTHWVVPPRTLVFSEPNIKSAVVMPLTMNSLVREESRDGKFVLVSGAGWVFADHLAPIAVYQTDPLITEAFAGMPYYWGGREAGGLDCSGLVQQAHYACAMASARDTDMQAQLGEAVAPTDLQAGDLVLWKGHVGMVGQGDTLIHANAFFMMTTFEPLAAAIDRIGPPIAYRRVARP